MPDRSCPTCHEPVAAHQTLCPSCRTPVPSEAGPVATDSTAFTFTAPPPRRPTDPAPPPTEPVIGSVGPPTDPITGSAPPVWSPDPTTVVPAPEPGPFPVAPAAPIPGTGDQIPHPARDLITSSPQPQPPNPAAAVPEPAWAAAPAPTFAGTLGTPGATQLDERGNLPGGAAGLVAAVLVTIGVFLPWIGVEGRDVSGWAASDDAKVLLAVAGLATVAAALLIGGARSLVLRLGMVGLGVVTLALGAYEVASARDIDDFDVSLGIGLLLVLAGGVILAVAGAVTRHRRFLRTG